MSITIEQIDQRLASLETAFIEMQQRLGLTPPPSNWVERVSGSLADIPEEDYQRFLDCCRAVRHGQMDPDSQEPPS